MIFRKIYLMFIFILAFSFLISITQSVNDNSDISVDETDSKQSEKQLNHDEESLPREHHSKYNNVSFKSGGSITISEKPEKSKMSGRNYDYYSRGRHTVYFSNISTSQLEFNYMGEYLIISPLSMQFINGTHAATPVLVSSAAVKARDNTVTYKNIFGEGTEIVFENNDNQLKEMLVIKNASSLPGLENLNGDIYLTYTGLMNFSEDIDVFVNGIEYESGLEKTIGRVEFKKNESTLFYFESPYVYDDAGEKVSVEFMLHKNILFNDQIYLQDNNSIFWTICVPYGWINESVPYQYSMTKWVNGTWNGTSWVNGTKIDEKARGYLPLRKYPIIIDPTISYDFGFSGADAWDYAGASAPEPGSSSWIPASASSRAAISSRNSIFWTTKKTTGHDQFNFQLYRFNPGNRIPVLDITAGWTGYGESTVGYNTSLYIWNFNSHSYELLNSTLLASSGTLTGNINNNGDYTGSTREIYILSSARHYNYAPPKPAGVAVNPGTSYVTISWLPAIDPDGDNVQYFVQIDGVGNSGWINTTSWYRAGLSPEKFYTFSVKSRDTFANAQSSQAAGSFWTLRDYGSCPFVYAWNGTEYEYVTDIAGGVINIPKKTVGHYNFSYIDLPGLEPDNNRYIMKLREVIDEIDYVDQMSLLLVDHPKNVEIVSSGAEKRLWEEVPFEIYTIKNARAPSSAIYMDGSNITSDLLSVDGKIAPADFYNDDFITLDFGRVKKPANARLVIDGWTFFNEKMRSGMVINEDVWPYIEVVDTDGTWVKAKDFGYITGDFKTMVINLSGAFLSDDHRLRIHTGKFRSHSEIIIDRIRLDTSEPEPVSVSEIPLTSADLHYRGGATLYYSSTSSRILAFDDSLEDEPKPYYGNYTKFGDVLPLLASVDDMYVIMRHGDELALEFDNDRPVPKGKERTPILKTFLWFKVLSPESPLPLPFSNMTEYPYDISLEHYTADPVHLDYLANWNTREYLRPGPVNDTESHEADNMTISGQVNHSLNTDHVNLTLTTGGGNTIWKHLGSSAANVRQGDQIKLFAQAKDDYCLESAILATNENGVWKNVSGRYGSPVMAGCTDNWTWTNFTWENNSISPGTAVSWKIYYTNNLGTSNVTDTMTFSILEAVAPEWRHQGSSSGSAFKGSAITLYAQGRDDTCLKSAVLVTNESGAWKDEATKDMGCAVNNWTWSNFTWANGSVPAGEVVGWKICYYDNANKVNCTDVRTFNIKNVFTWARPSESMVNPAGWGGMAAPLDYRTINITSVPLDLSGHFIFGLSPLEARIYGPAGNFIGSVNLTGEGPYSGVFIVDDQLLNGQYAINISSHPELNGFFYVLRWSCRNCHTDSGRYPGTFDNIKVHSNHTSTSHSTRCNSCHFGSTHDTVTNILPHAYKPTNCECHPDGTSAHIVAQSCTNSCHKSPALTCNECHNDIKKSSDIINNSILSTAYGADVHQGSVTCINCHGTLPSPSSTPLCPDCHPLPGSTPDNAIPGSLGLLTHSPEQKVPCGSCHNVEHSIKMISYTIEHCRQCHTDVVHNRGNECSVCHGPDPHNITGGAGPDCVLCHDIGGSAPAGKHINVSAVKLGVHRNLNNGTLNTTVLTDEVDKACWACHGNGTEPSGGHPENFRTPYACNDCHLAIQQAGAVNALAVNGKTFDVNSIGSLPPEEQEECVACHADLDPGAEPLIALTTTSIVSATLDSDGTPLVYEHIPAPYNEDISSTVVSGEANCTGCHNKSKIQYTDSGFSLEANVSHYASLTDLAHPTIRCSLCHKDKVNASAYWANTIRHAAKSEADSFCRNCHNSTLAANFHSRPLVKPSNIHNGFDWYDNDYIISHDPNEACKSCHSAHGSLAKLVCEDCHIERGSGPINYSGDLRYDINSTMPFVYTHTNFSASVNVPDQSGIYGDTASSCFAFDPATLAGTCHGIAFDNTTAGGGYYAFKGSDVASPYHSTRTIDRLPDTTDCIFCHNQSNVTIRKAWGNAVQITDGSHNWYTGNNVSHCYSCHISPGTAIRDFHSANITGGGGPDCISCHDINTNFAVHTIDIEVFITGPHYGMNGEAALNQGYNISNGACWACHDSEGGNISGMGDRFNNPYICIDCHLDTGSRAGSYGSPMVYNHYRNGSAVKALGNVSTDIQSCIGCHENVTGMINLNSDDNTGSFQGDSVGLTGGNRSFYHYGKNFSLAGTSNYEYCAYCHNSSSSEFAGVFQTKDNTAIVNHSLNNESGIPSCDNKFCHNSTSKRIHDKNLAVPELTTKIAGGPDSRICLLCHDTYYQLEAPGPGRQVKHFSLNCSECHLYLPRDIHGIKYLQNDGKYSTSNNVATIAGCAGCHVTAIYVQGNISIPIPEVLHPRS